MTDNLLFAKLVPVVEGDRTYNSLMFCCPGCAENGASGLLMLPVSGETGPRPCWNWDGNLETPTLDPSILTTGADNFICHSYLRNGVFEFLGDCTHTLASKIVPMAPLPDWITKKR